MPEYGTAGVEVGTNLVKTGEWQIWTFIIDTTAGAALATCDVYLDGVIQATDVACADTNAPTDGKCSLIQRGEIAGEARLSYTDYFQIGSDVTWRKGIKPKKVRVTFTADTNFTLKLKDVNGDTIASEAVYTTKEEVDITFGDYELATLEFDGAESDLVVTNIEFYGSD